MEFWEELRQEYGEDVHIGDLLIVADVLAHNNPVAVWCSDPRYRNQSGLLAEAQETVDRLDAARRPQPDLEDDE